MRQPQTGDNMEKDWISVRKNDAGDDHGDASEGGCKGDSGNAQSCPVQERELDQPRPETTSKYRQSTHHKGIWVANDSTVDTAQEVKNTEDTSNKDNEQSSTLQTPLRDRGNPITMMNDLTDLLKADNRKCKSAMSNQTTSQQKNDRLE